MKEMHSKEAEIKLVVGLGNPGPQYSETRHNIGFMLADLVAGRFSDGRFSYNARLNAEITRIEAGGSSIVVMKPRTYMNRSGNAVLAAVKMFKIRPEEVLVLHDDLERTLGKCSLRFGGSARGHNGVKSVISAIGENFWRCRFGIGRPENKEDVPGYVLSEFSEGEVIVVARSLEECREKIVASFFRNG